MMAEGREEAQWWHTAALRSTIYAVVGIKKMPGELHPFERERNRPKTPEQLAAEAEADGIVWKAMCDSIAKGRG